MSKGNNLILSVSAACLLSTSVVNAENHTLSCKLYNASDVSAETNTKVNLEQSEQTLVSGRTSSFCVFDDGVVTEKHFVVNQRVLEGGAKGIVQGISVYTMANGDSVTATFTGDWGSEGFIGRYQVIDGTGKYSGATGDGKFTGAKSDWATTSVFDVVLNVTTQ